MGNHDVGQGMAAAAKVVKLLREKMIMPDGVKFPAMDVLDVIAEPYRGADAEFDDALNPGEPLFDLVHEAFEPESPKPDLGDEDSYDEWCDAVYTPFRQRYGFC